jgi:hypothetical protein
MKSINQLVTYFDEILQSDIDITCDGKSVRKGTFILYTVKDYVITLILKTPTNNKSYDIFYPFDVTSDNNIITLDYTIDKLTSRKVTTAIPVQSSNNKFLNKKLKIRYV